MLARVQKLEQAAFVRSPLEVAFGSLDAFEAELQQGIVAGKLCHLDVPVIVNCIRRWHREQVWGNWSRRGQVWSHGGGPL
jgi:hypothetical protein